MPTYAVYHVIHYQASYPGQMARMYTPKWFVTDVPAGKDKDDIKLALERAGYDVEPASSRMGIPLPDLAWIDFDISRLKEAPPQIQGAFRQLRTQRIAWEDLYWNPEEYDRD
jgi:hypothetical protein